MFQTQINKSLLPFSFFELTERADLAMFATSPAFLLLSALSSQSFKNFLLQASETLEAYIA